MNRIRDVGPWCEESGRLGDRGGRRSAGGGVRVARPPAADGAAGAAEAAAQGAEQAKGADRRLHAGPAMRAALAVDVGVEDVDLPQVGVGVGDPELGLAGVAALNAILPL